MKLSTTTGLYQQSGGTTALRNLNEVLRVLREVGYDTIDLSFCFQNKPDYILRGDDWEAKRTRQYRRKAGNRLLSEPPALYSGRQRRVFPGFSKAWLCGVFRRVHSPRLYRQRSFGSKMGCGASAELSGVQL